MTREIKTDVVIVGGGVGGVAAAIAVAESGLRCVVLEPSAWVGGQLTNQAVPPDENRWVESHGATRSYARFRERVRQHYRDHESLTPAALSAPHLNPGGGWVSRLCCSPRIAHAVLTHMLREAGGNGRIEAFTRVHIESVDRDGDTVAAVQLRDDDGQALIVTGSVFLEASETGDLLELGGIEHRLGAEAAQTHDELHGLPEAEAACQQPPTWCFAVEHHPGQDYHQPDAPVGYAELSKWVPTMHDRPWPGALFSWKIPTHGDTATRTLGLVPAPDEPHDGEWELWRYRRSVDASIHADGRRDVSLFNVVQMDDWRTPVLSLPRASRASAFEDAKQLALCFLHWMRTEAPRHDGGFGYPGLRLHGESLGTDDGFAMMPYIREPRRMEAVRMLCERDVGSEQRRHLDAGIGGVPPEGRCETFEDSLAIGHYHIDLHPTPTGRNSIYVESCPFQIPLRSLIPVRTSNVIAAGKCLGVTHIVNGATRTHAVEWAIGEAAGVAAAACVKDSTHLHALVSTSERIRHVREAVEARGAPTRWPWDPA